MINLEKQIYCLWIIYFLDVLGPLWDISTQQQGLPSLHFNASSIHLPLRASGQWEALRCACSKLRSLNRILDGLSHQPAGNGLTHPQRWAKQGRRYTQTINDKQSSAVTQTHKIKSERNSPVPVRLTSQLHLLHRHMWQRSRFNFYGKEWYVFYERMDIVKSVL